MSQPGARRGQTLDALPGGSRERILDTALELVARYGYEGMSLQLLADQVGLHKSTLFHHFSGKSDLSSGVVTRVMTDVLERLQPLESAEPPDLEQLVAIAEELDDFFAEHRWTALFVIRVLLGPGDEFHRIDFSKDADPVVRLFAVLGSWLDRARRAGAVRPLSVRQTIVNLMALVLFYPALVDAADELPFGDPRSPDVRRRRKHELADTLRRALAP